LTQTLQNGWRRTLPAILAPLVTDGPIIALVLLILTQTPGWFLTVLRILGGLFILYLARGTFLALNAPVADSDSTPDAQHGFAKAIVMNALSPGPYLFWGIIAGPVVIDAWGQSPGLSVSFVVGFYAAFCSSLAVFIILTATARRLGNQVSRILLAVSGLALLAFGLYQLWTGVSELLT
jgi:threonine/homoserine/homoserine lactone efflux protein